MIRFGYLLHVQRFTKQQRTTILYHMRAQLQAVIDTSSYDQQKTTISIAQYMLVEIIFVGKTFDLINVAPGYFDVFDKTHVGTVEALTILRIIRAKVLRIVDT